MKYVERLSKKIAVAAVVAVAAIALLMAEPTTTYAADLGGGLYTPDNVDNEDNYTAPYVWTGGYVSGNIGWSTYDSEVDASSGGVSFFNFDGINGRGGVVGLEAGANYQIGKVVVGASIGYDWNFAETTLDIGAGPGALKAKIENPDSYYAQGRVGIALDDVLPYALVRYTRENGGAVASASGLGSAELDERQGWGVGGGIEFAVAGNVTLKGEYVHTFFGEEDVATLGAGPGAINLSERTDTDTVKAGMSFKF